LVGCGDLCFEILTLWGNNRFERVVGPEMSEDVKDMGIEHWTDEQMLAMPDAEKCDWTFLVAMGKSSVREKVARRYEEAGFAAAGPLVHKTCLLVPGCEVVRGVVIMPFAHVGPKAVVGPHTLLNVHSSVGHHAHTGFASVLFPGSRLSGHCVLGDGAMLGTNAYLLPGTTLPPRHCLLSPTYDLRTLIAINLEEKDG
jgi:hypothetical protein